MRLAIALLLIASVQGRAEVPPTTNALPVVVPPSAQLYDATRDAKADVDAALARAKASNKRVILLMGANWCHDSTSLAGRFELPRFKAMLLPLYEIVYVDVGKPQTGHGRNIDIAARFGITKIKGTPTVLVLSPEGKLLNKKEAPKWSNAASRSDDDIFKTFEKFGDSHG